jgi:chitin synthase
MSFMLAMAPALSSLANHTVNSGDLVDLISSSASATVYPNDDAIVTVLNSRILPYARIATTNMLAVNPFKTLANVSDISVNEYGRWCYKDTSLPFANSWLLQSQLDEFAAQMYLLMRRRNQFHT